MKYSVWINLIDENLHGDYLFSADLWLDSKATRLEYTIQWTEILL